MRHQDRTSTQSSGEKCTDRPNKVSSSSTAVQDALEDNSKHIDPSVKEEPQHDEDQQDDAINIA
jgi:phage gp36-like protein